jgi:signal transduction histidine kinase
VSFLIEDVEVLAAGWRLRVEARRPSTLLAEVDWPLLRQAFSNVLQNAVRYNEPDGWIRIVLEHREAAAMLEVCSGGPGIPAADQPRLFDRFFRGDTARSRTIEGAGLGWSLAQEIVRAHGGALELKESQPGRTCFAISLPSRPVESLPDLSSGIRNVAVNANIR